MKKQHKEPTPQENEEVTQQETNEQSDDAAEAKVDEPKDTTHKSKGSLKERLTAFLRTKKGKIVAAVAAVVLLVGVVFAVPASRYAVAGLVIKKDVSLLVLDNTTAKSVSGVQLTLNGQTVTSDGSGKATLHNVPVGEWQITAKKNYYQDTKVGTLVPILASQSAVKVAMVATGRQVPVTVTNKISGKAVGGVVITANDSTSTTDADGKAVIVLPAGKDVVNATFKAGGYNDATADITVTDQEDAKNAFTITPAGKVYFLSKRTGKINVMKSDLDGANATVVLQGTGKEDNNYTTLLASRDWKYLALQAKRDSDTPKLYFINTADDKLSVIDEGTTATFEPIGWYNEHFVYRVGRDNLHDWEAKRGSLKSFNATTNKITTIDDLDGAGTNATNWAHESYSRVYILDNLLVYAKYWDNASTAPLLLSGKKDTIVTVKPDGSGKQVVKDFDSSVYGYIDSILYNVQDVVFLVNTTTASKYYEYENGKVTESTTVTSNNFYGGYPTYLVSPSGQKTFWKESRDGKAVLFIGDKDGANGKEMVLDDGYVQYGWFGDDYILLSKNGSELYILPADSTTNVKPLKITDYHKPAFNGAGYGYGYGGF